MAAAYYHLGYMEEALSNRRKGAACAAPISSSRSASRRSWRCSARTSFQRGDISKRRADKAARRSATRNLALAVLLLRKCRTRTDDARTALDAPFGLYRDAVRRSAGEHRGSPGRRGAARRRLSDSWRETTAIIHVAYSLGATYAELGERIVRCGGGGPPPTRGPRSHLVRT